MSLIGVQSSLLWTAGNLVSNMAMLEGYQNITVDHATYMQLSLYKLTNAIITKPFCSATFENDSALFYSRLIFYLDFLYVKSATGALLLCYSVVIHWVMR
jgi:hypothetical protein